MADALARSKTKKKKRSQSLDETKQIKPQDFLEKLVTSMGHSPRTVFANDMKAGYFLEVTPAMVESYDLQTALAVRQEDLEVFRQRLASGTTLQCCNQFGESIIHTACRRGSSKVLDFLVLEAGVSLRVKCDQGRTPLHDACWTSDPNFDVIRTILRDSPDMLWIKDVRGFTPLAYVSPNQWSTWCTFLEEHRELLLPRSNLK